MLKNRLEKVISKGCDFLIDSIEKNEYEKYRNFYGHLYFLAVLKRNDRVAEDISDKIISLYSKLDFEDSEFHHEFNNFVFLKEHQDEEKLKSFFQKMIFKGTPCTNWTLLRCASQLIVDPKNEYALDDVYEKIQKYQLDSGLILDDKGVKSFQYHCFSMAMIFEIYSIVKDKKLLLAFDKGVRFIRHFILENGRTLYIGRGQEQTFGYGTLIYILSVHYELTKDKTIPHDIEKIIRLIEDHQAEDGELPLVLNGITLKNPYLVDMKDEKYLGWYPYNNQMDYFPFLLYFLSRALPFLSNVNVSSGTYAKQSYLGPDFRVIRKKGYTAILSRPGGYWTNDISFPLIFLNNRFYTPIYGGEQFQESLYSDKDLALPFHSKLKSYRRFIKSFFLGNTLIVLTSLGIVFRKYSFYDDRVKVKSRFIGVPGCRDKISFLEHTIPKYDFSGKIYKEEKSYSPLGKVDQIVVSPSYKINLSINGKES